MNNLLLLAGTVALSLSPVHHNCHAFLSGAPTHNICNGKCSSSSSSRLHGINEWRDQALEAKYTLDSYQQSNTPAASSTTLSAVPATVPILPFPFSDILLQGQRTQLNLYEKRFHDLFQDAMENHCGMVGMGLLAGNGMITSLPLCEVELFSRFGAEENWIDRNDGMGNGSIFVTIRAVGRCKIVESDLLQEEPYMKARVCELLDEDATMSGIREKSNSKVSGESGPIEVASLVAGNIESLIKELEGMEEQLEEAVRAKEEINNYLSEREEKDDVRETGGSAGGEDGDEVMNRRLVNSQLEALFMDDSSEGVDMEETAKDDETIGDDEDEEEDQFAEDENEDNIRRYAQYLKAFESAKESDTFGYVLQPTSANDNPSQPSQSKQIRTAKDLTAISWAVFCTGEKNNIQRDVMKIQSLDMTNVMQRLQLGVAMLSEEKKKMKAKLALAGIKEDTGGDDGSVGGCNI